MARNVAVGLVERGYEVTAIIPRKTDQPDYAEIDGVNVYSYDPKRIAPISHLMRKVDADIYHTMEPNWGTYIAQKSMPDRKHVVTSIDPRNAYDWLVEFRHYSIKRKIMFPLIVGFEKNPLITWAVRRAHFVGCQTLFIIPKVRKMYGLSKDPQHLPNPIVVPKQEIKKADRPTVLFLARWDHRKRPEMFLELASKFPDVEFIMLGKSRDAAYDAHLKNKYGQLPNVNIIGFIDQYRDPRFSQILERTWILISTASREGLPASFQEAAAHQCAILSHVNPDNYASQFGYWAKDDEFEYGLRELMRNNMWQAKGCAGYEYITKTNAVDVAIDRHEEVYCRLMAQ